MWITHNQTVFGNENENFNLFLEYTSGTPFMLTGVLPSGLFFDPTVGQITGILPTVNETTTFPITLRIVDGNEVFDLAVNIVVTNSQSVWVTNPQLPSFPQFQFIDFQLEVFDSRDDTQTFTIINGELPSSLNMNINGKISGLLTDASGQYSFTVKANESNITQTFIFTISNDPPEPYWSTLSGWIGDIAKDQFFSFQFKSNGTVYTLDPNTPLPSGLNITQNGFLSGVPNDSTIGNIEFNIIVDDTVTRTFFVRANVVFDINLLNIPTQKNQIINITIDKNEPSYLKIPSTGIGKINTFTIEDGSLPDGLILQNNTGLIIGNSQEVGSFDFIVQVKNNFGTTIVFFVNLVVNDNQYSGRKISMPLLTNSKRLLHDIIMSYIPYETTFRPSDKNFGLKKYTNIDLFVYANNDSTQIYERFKDKIGITAHGYKFKLLPVQGTKGQKVCEVVVLMFKDSNEQPSNNLTLSMNSIKQELIQNNIVPNDYFFNWQSIEYRYHGNNLIIPDHDLETGQIIMFKNQPLQPPLQNNIRYFVIKKDQNTIQLAQTSEFARNGIKIDLNIPNTPFGILHTRYNAIPIIYCKNGLGMRALQHLISLNKDLSKISLNTKNLILDDEMIMLDGNFPRRL